MHNGSATVGLHLLPPTPSGKIAGRVGQADRTLGHAADTLPKDGKAEGALREVMCSVCVCVGAPPLSIFVLVINPYPYVLHRSLAFDLDGF